MRLFLFLSLMAVFLLAANAPKSSKRPPNVLIVLADDLGYGELGCYGQQIIETPNIDALAREGMRFTQHYTSSPVCAPARCAMLTGMHSGHAYIRGNDEWRDRGEVWSYRKMFENPALEGQRPIPDSLRTMAETLKGSGYRTGLVGKWGLGAPGTEGVPNRQGFDFFFGYNCQRQAHTYYPMHLWKNESRVLLKNKEVAPHTGLAPGADPRDPATYADFSLKEYAPDLMLDQALSFMRQNRRRPFFLVFASPLPHLALQAPKKWVDYYRKKLGPEEPYTGDKGYFPNFTPRATYAAMISCLDEQVGRLKAELKKLGLDDNTVILFTSDNGPTYTGGVDAPYFNSAGPFVEAFGRTKGFVYEGGIRVPLIARWPGRIGAGSTSPHLAALHDFYPTICELAGIPAPSGLDGLSFASALLGSPEKQRAREYLYWEFPENGGQQAVREGSWKAVRQGIHKENLEVELYNLDADPQESVNLAGQYPERVRHFEAVMRKEHTPSALKAFRYKIFNEL